MKTARGVMALVILIVFSAAAAGAYGSLVVHVFHWLGG